MSGLSHVDDSGRARMVDVSGQGCRPRARRRPTGISPAGRRRWSRSAPATRRRARCIHTAELAGIMAAKRTAELIPLCHPLPLTKVEVRDRDRRRPARLPRRRRGPDERGHRRRDGGADRRLGRLPDVVRHAESDRPDDGDRRHRGRSKTRRQVGRLAPRMISFDEAVELIRSVATPLGTETVPHCRAAGRVLAAPVMAQIDSPRADVSAMDGYAVREADLGNFPRRCSWSANPSPGGAGTGRCARAPASAFSPVRRCPKAPTA